MKQQTKVYICSTVAMAFKLSLKFYSPLQLIFLSSVVSVFIFGLILLFSTKWFLLFVQTRKDLLSSALMGFPLVFIHFILGEYLLLLL